MTNNEAYHNHKKLEDWDNKIQNVCIPSGLSNKELDAYCKRKSGKVKTYNLNKQGGRSNEK